MEGSNRPYVAKRTTPLHQASARMIAAALRYFAFIFGLGFLLGTARTLIIAPLIGVTGGVVLELPVMIVASALLARQTMELYRIKGAGRALGMGGLAFPLLMATEALLANLLTGQGPVRWFESLSETPGWIGLVGQITFGLCPLFWSYMPARRIKPSEARPAAPAQP